MQICWSFTRQVRVDLFTGKQTLVRHMEKEKKKKLALELFLDTTLFAGSA